MAIFNSYVSLPEGNKYDDSLLWDSFDVFIIQERPVVLHVTAHSSALPPKMGQGGDSRRVRTPWELRNGGEGFSLGKP